MIENYHNRDKCDVIEDLRVIHKEYKRENRINQRYIVFCNGKFERKKLYTDELWAKVITEFPDTTYLPINNMAKSVCSAHDLGLGSLVDWVIRYSKDSRSKDSRFSCN